MPPLRVGRRRGRDLAARNCGLREHDVLAKARCQQEPAGPAVAGDALEVGGRPASAACGSRIVDREGSSTQ